MTTKTLLRKFRVLFLRDVSLERLSSASFGRFFVSPSLSFEDGVHFGISCSRLSSAKIEATMSTTKASLKPDILSWMT